MCEIPEMISTIDSCVYHDKLCDTQPWAWLQAPTAVFRSTQPSVICGAIKSLLAKYTTLLHTFNGPFSWTTQVSWYQKGKINLDFTEARDSEWQWHHKSAPRSRQITMPAPHRSDFYRLDALPAAQPTASKH